MLKAKVLRCITNGAPVARFDNDRRLADGQRDLGPTFNAMRKAQQERRNQDALQWSLCANVANQLEVHDLYGMLSRIGASHMQGNNNAAGENSCIDDHQSECPEKFW